VNMETKKVAPFPPDIQANLAVMKAAHTRLPPPKDIGRVIGIPRREELAEQLLAAGTRH
jgi:acyl-CoA thioester hydrolase